VTMISEFLRFGKVVTTGCHKAGAQILRYRVAHNRTCCVSRAEAERRVE
jgi:hypothetical protein